MDILTLLLIAVGLSMDAFSVAICKGLAMKKVSIREMAISLKINPNTIQKGLVELENQGFIYTERTNGKYVTNDKSLIDNYKNIYARETVIKYLDDMKNLGFSKEDVILYMKEMGDK